MAELAGIHIPREDEIPSELRLQSKGLRPRIPKVDIATLPKPALWYIQVIPVAPPEEYEMGETKLALVTDTIKNLDLMASTGIVTGKGPLAYSEKRGFPENVKDAVSVGDWVHFSPHSGVATQVHGESDKRVKVLYLSEKDIVAKVSDPESLVVSV